jgi:hypothetical protein
MAGRCAFLLQWLEPGQPVPSNIFPILVLNTLFGVPVDQIAWEMRYGVPSQKYREFVARHLLHKEAKQPLVDPFALDVDTDRLREIYVIREEVESETCQPGTMIVMGPQGSGKTTLFRELLGRLHDQCLIVGLPLTEVGVSVPEQELMEGKLSLLTPDILVRHIFNTYWENLLCDPKQRTEFVPQLRQDQSWMVRLRWFYQRFPPVCPEIPEEFELITWLNASPSREPFGPQIAPDYALRELIRLVTFAPPQQGRFGIPTPQPYVRVQILVDGAEYLSNNAMTRLIRDAQKLYNLYRVQLKIFFVSAWQELVEGMDCVREGRVRVYLLPHWNEQELRQVLYFRVMGWREGEPAEEREWTRYDWGDIPGLEISARPKFVETIVKSALRTYEIGDDLDAPVHALRLARGLVAACAGCWKEYGYVPPLDIDSIRELAHIYWKAN